MNCISILLLNLLLLSIGITTLFNKQSIIFIIIGIELIIQSTVSNYICFNRLHCYASEGLVLAVFITAIAVCEMILFLTILLNLYNYYKTYNIKS